MERRAGAKGNAGQERTLRTQGRDGAPQGLDRVRQAARQGKETRFTALWRHVDVDRLREAFHALKRDAAPGVDGLTSRDYETDLDSKLADPCDRVHKGGPYHPLPSRRRFIPKADGKQRPLAVAALEDKIVQAVQEALNATPGSQSGGFLGFSYGFRPGRGAHDALVVGIGKRKVNWILGADIRSFFDSVSQEWLLRFLEHRTPGLLIRGPTSASST